MKVNKHGFEFDWHVFVLLCADLLMINFLSAFALLVRFDFTYEKIPEIYACSYETSIYPFTAMTIIILFCFRLYHRIWRFASGREIWHSFLAISLSEGIQICVIHMTQTELPRSYFFLQYILVLFGVILVRFSYRATSFFETLWTRCSKKNKERIMLIGAGCAGELLISEYQTSNGCNGKVCCIIDDDSTKYGKYIKGVQVVGNRDCIMEYVGKYQIDTIVFAIPSASAKEKKEILQLCQMANCEIRTLPGIYQILTGEVNLHQLRKVEIEDLLGREPIKVNMDEVMQYVTNKTILVTGGGGSIGSELCRQIASHEPKALIIFDIYENNAYEIEQELKRNYKSLNLIVCIGSVRNKSRLESIFKKYKPDIVYHAAAHKHVPLMENSPNEAIKNNVFGTYNTALAAIKYKAKRFVLISTDKAVNPTNIMGASKRICEMIIQMLNKTSETELVAVRFGNVLGSNGSVIPLFKHQIEEGGPVTITHPDIIRYFMTIPEAVSLVLQAGVYAKGGEIFVLDMGEPVKILDLANNLIRLSGYVPGKDIKIVYTGLRPGEKLYEELLMKEEGMKSTKNKLIYVGRPLEFDEQELTQKLKELKVACYQESEDIRRLVKEIVVTYQSKVEG